MTRIIFLALLTSFYSFSAFAQNDRKWSLYAGLGGVNMMENRYDDGHLYVPTCPRTHENFSSFLFCFLQGLAYLCGRKQQ